MSTIPVVNVGGILRPSSPFPPGIETVLCDGTYYICYTYQDALPKPGHQNWMKPNSFDATISAAPYYAGCVLDTEGVVYPSRWCNIETSFGIYDFSKTVAALDHVHSQGKQLIIRLFWKSYYAEDVKPIPDYIVDDFATYGGDSGSGGLYLNAFEGWSARLDNINVITRLKALISAYAAAVIEHPALRAFMIDESTWSVYNSGMPLGLTTEDVIAANRDIWAYSRLAFAGKEFYPNINYIDGATNLATIEELELSQNNGDKIGVTDTFRIPEMATRKQPIYPALPQNNTTLVIVDKLSSDGPTGAALIKRMIDNARQACRLGADITVWDTTDGYEGEIWAATVNAINLIG